MNIALVSTLYAPNSVGGAERVAQDLAEALVRQGHTVTVLCVGKEPRTYRTELQGVRVHYFRLRNLYWPFPVAHAPWGMKAAWHAIDSYNPLMARAVGDALDEIRPDLVNTHNIAGFSVAVWKAIKRRALPLVHTLHDHYLLCPYSTMFKNGRNCETPCLPCRISSVSRRWMTHVVDGVIGVSRFILERHLKMGLFPNARPSVVYSGYRRPAGAPLQPTRATHARLRIGFLGGLHPNKGLDRLIDAFLSLPRDRAELWIAGAGDPQYEATARGRTRLRDDVHWQGFVEPETFLPGLDVLVVPSLVHEAMGRVVVEAICFGVPVIAANRGGIPELVSAGCGWLFDPDNSGELASALKQCLDRPERLHESRESTRLASIRFNHDATVSGYLAAYHEVMNRPAVSRRP